MRHSDWFATYSIVARDPQTRQLGVAVQTHQMSVGRSVPWLLPGVGALATQSLTNVHFGPMGLEMLRQGVAAPQVIAALVASDAGANRRQVAVVDVHGGAAAWTGDGCIPEAGHWAGDGFSVQANMMTRPTVIEAMRHAFEHAEGDLAQRMLAALQAAQAEDGDIRGMQSAALMVVPGENEDDTRRLYDLRVDEHAQPVVELARLVRLRGAVLLENEAEAAFERGDRPRALSLWQQARERAPELEEIAYWQAVALADAGDVPAAAAILRPVLANDARREHWLDLLRRLEKVRLIERQGAAEELIRAL
ncbi:MAG: DUF1028 domain-containing protein [Anaerolineae bacterium]